MDSWLSRQDATSHHITCDLRSAGALHAYCHPRAYYASGKSDLVSSTCPPLAPAECSLQSLMSSVLDSITQYNGTSQGYLFDPATMQPLFNNTGIVDALLLIEQLLALSPNVTNVDVTGTCSATGSGMFLEGRCAMTIGTGSLLKVGHYLM